MSVCGSEVTKRNLLYTCTHITILWLTEFCPEQPGKLVYPMVHAYSTNLFIKKLITVSLKNI